MTNTINKQNRLIKSIVLVLALILTLTLAGCDNTTGLDYSDFSKDHLLSWQDVLEQDEDQYLVYYYGVNCSHCKTVKEDVLTFADSNQADLKVYFIDSGVVSYENYLMYPIKDPISGLDIQGTPTMMVMKDGKIKAMAVGPSIIADLLDQINKGTYGFID